jgi:alpha-glucosidase
LTDWTPRDLQVNLDFLADGEYEVELFRDGVNADRTARDYKKVTMIMNVKDGKAEPMNVHLAPGCGFAAKITKK